MNKLPCIDCITFPICREEFKARMVGNGLLKLLSPPRDYLREKCSMLDRYFLNSENQFWNIQQQNLISFTNLMDS